MKKGTERNLRHLSSRRQRQIHPGLSSQTLVLAVAMHMYTNSGCQDLPGTREEEEDGDDYENMAPPYKDLPPKPDSMAPPRPPRAGKKTEKPPLPCKSPKIKGPDFTPVICTSPPLGVIPECPPFQPSLAATPGSQLSQKSRCPGCYQEERLVVFLCLLVVVSLLLSCTGLAVTLIKYQEVVGELRMLTFQQTAWQASVTGTAGLAGLKKDIDHIRTNTNQSLVELRGLLDCTRTTCPEGWLPFEGKCYYFSPRTKSWDEARKFCQENNSHLVIISSLPEQKFVAKAHGSPRIYWLGLSDRDREGDWKWLDGSPVTLRELSSAEWRPAPLGGYFSPQPTSGQEKPGPFVTSRENSVVLFTLQSSLLDQAEARPG